MPQTLFITVICRLKTQIISTRLKSNLIGVISKLSKLKVSVKIKGKEVKAKSPSNLKKSLPLSTKI